MRLSARDQVLQGRGHAHRFERCAPGIAQCACGAIAHVYADWSSHPFPVAEDGLTTAEYEGWPTYHTAAAGLTKAEALRARLGAA